jgi:hypothetical protein
MAKCRTEEVPCSRVARPMGAREVFRSIRPRVVTAALAALTLAVAGASCGDDDFANEPRPAAPVVLTAKVDSKQIVVSPAKLGAGLVNITVSNQSEDPVRLTLVGPGSEDNLEGSEVPPGGVGNLKASLDEGDYEVNGGERSDARPAKLKVGPPRPSSSGDVLLP